MSMSAAFREDWLGRVVDQKFTLLRWLGGSGSSEVFLTELPGSPATKAAIKLIPADAEAEARLTAWSSTESLSHPHLIRLFHSGLCQIQGQCLLYAVMELAEEDLSQIIPERPLTASEAREMLGPILDGLAYLHAKGFVHSHLKPSNVTVVENQVKISSDRLQTVGEQPRPISAPTVYDAPEISKTISQPADVWSLGVTLVEALTQRPPDWDREKSAPPVVPASVPQPFSSIAQECLRLDPAQRCGVNDIRLRLQSPSLGPSPVNKPDRTGLGKRAALGLGVAAVAILAVLGTLKLRSANPSSTSAEPRPAQLASPTPETSPQQVQTQPAANAKGEVAERVQPQVSRGARQTIQGKIRVIVRVQVDTNGAVSNAKLDSAGPSRYFANSALEAARGWRFKPPQVNGQPVASIWVLRFRFGRRSTEVSPTQLRSRK
jgi:TonB family protein